MANVFGREISVFRQPLLFGLATGLHASVIILLVGSMFIGVRPGRAEVAGETVCFARDECLAAGTRAEDNCDETHCFCTASDSTCYNAGETHCSGSQGKCFAKWPAVDLSVSIGATRRVLDLSDYIARVYSYAVGVATLIAAVMFMIGGFQYLTAGGDAGRVSKGKERIKDALIGLFLTLGAYLVLNTVNPDLLTLRLPKVALVKKKQFVGCPIFEGSVRCGEQFWLKPKEGYDAKRAAADPRNGYEVTKDKTAPGVTTECRGSSCSAAGSPYSDGTHRCALQRGARPPSATTDAAAPSTGPVPPYECRPCLGLGATCTGLGRTSACCGGFCGSSESTTRQAGGGVGGDIGVAAAAQLVDGTCSNGGLGIACGANFECFHGHCAGSGLPNTGVAGSACVAGVAGAPCARQEDCGGGTRCVVYMPLFGGTCQLPVNGSLCHNDSDCGEGGDCNGDDVCGPLWRCDGNNRDNDPDCVNNSAAAAAGATHCFDDDGDNFCTTKAEGAICEGNNNCNSGLVCCTACGDGSQGICVRGAAGIKCAGNDGFCQRALDSTHAFCSDTGSRGGGPDTCRGLAREGEPCAARSATLSGCADGLICHPSAYKCVREGT